LSRLKDTLAPIGEVYFNGLILTCKVENKELIVFPDGRVMIKGTTDEVEAKSLYDKYIGA
jgi:adenylyltransferase/sulfurtransferase